MARTRGRITGGAGAALSSLWGIYSQFNTAADLPGDADKLTKMLADPPIYLPWAILALCVVVLAWSFWPSRKEDDDRQMAPPSAERSVVGLQFNDNSQLHNHGRIDIHHRPQPRHLDGEILASTPLTGLNIYIRAIHADDERCALGRSIEQAVNAVGGHAVFQDGTWNNRPDFEGLLISSAPNDVARCAASALARLFNEHGFNARSGPERNWGNEPNVLIEIGGR